MTSLGVRHMQSSPSDKGFAVHDSVIAGDMHVSNVHHHTHHQPVIGATVQSPATSSVDIAQQLAQIRQESTKVANPELAALLSLIFPGAGYIQLGMVWNGLLTLLISFALLVSIEIGFLFYVALGFMSAFHSYVIGHRMNGDHVHI